MPAGAGVAFRPALRFTPAVLATLPGPEILAAVGRAPPAMRHGIRTRPHPQPRLKCTVASFLACPLLLSVLSNLDRPCVSLEGGLSLQRTVRSLQAWLALQVPHSSTQCYFEFVFRRPRVTLEGGLSLQRVVRSSDGTRKLVFSLVGGEAAGGSVETVLIPVVRQQGLRDRLTICVSSQVG